MKLISPRLALLFFSAPLLMGCFGPDFTARDRRFERRLQEFVAEAPLGEQSANTTQTLLTDLFGAEVRQVCLLGGGDFVPDVKYQWSNAEAPIPVENLRDTGSGDLSLDGLVALVGIDEQSNGHVRRGWLGGECTDYSDGLACWPVDDELSLSVVEGTLFDAGPHAGRRARAVQLSRAGRQSCPLEPRLR